MAYSDRDRIIALAGVYQAAWCTQGVARRGTTDAAAMEAGVYSLFQIDAADVSSVFGGPTQVVSGLGQITTQIMGHNGRDPELIRYVIGLLQLERKLAGNPAMLRQLADGIATVQARLIHFHLLHDNILTQLAELYSTTISTLQPRIMVQGEARHLRDPHCQNKIRALLLAGVRAARLWFQVGGRRTQFLFRQRRILEGTKALLEEIERARQASRPVPPCRPGPE